MFMVNRKKWSRTLWLEDLNIDFRDLDVLTEGDS